MLLTSEGMLLTSELYDKSHALRDDKLKISFGIVPLKFHSFTSSIQMSESISQQISLLRSQIEHRRFTSKTLRILELILVARDIRSLLEIRSAIRDLLRSEIKLVLGEIAKKSTDEKLYTVDFFVKAFAVVGDAESCLALKYEALVLRETKYLIDHGLRVSYEEWYTFAKDSLDNGFYTIAVKGFENALLCIQSHPDLETLTMEGHMIDNIKRQRDLAAALVASHSVHTQTANYVKRKAVQDAQKCTSHSNNRRQVASIMFREGIKKRNMKKLEQSRSLLPNTSGFT